MNKYHAEFLSSFTSENVVGLFSRYNQAPKEITESWGILTAAKKYIPNLNDHIVVVVGDGCSPRTGALFAYYTRAEVYSIDPLHNLEHWADHSQKQAGMGFPIQRLTPHKGKIEDFLIDCEGKPLLVVWPHSHAPMTAKSFQNYSRRSDIALPCCNPLPKGFADRPHISYEDYHIISPKRTIHVWTEELL